MRRRLLPAHARGNRGNDAFAQIERIRSCHLGLASIPARILNRTFSRAGISVVPENGSVGRIIALPPSLPPDQGTKPDLQGRPSQPEATVL